MASWKRVITTSDDSNYKNSNLTASDIPADSITGAKIADDAIDSEHYVGRSIDTEHLQHDAVTALKIADNAVETAKIGAAQVTEAKLATDSVTIDKIAANAVHTSELKDGGVTTAKIADDAVTQAKIGAEAVGSTEIEAQSTDSGHLAAGLINDSQLIADDVINSQHYVNGSIDGVHLSANVITGQTAETSIADDDVVLIYDTSATLLRKMTKANFVSGLSTATGDITGVTAGTGLSGGGSSGCNFKC